MSGEPSSESQPPKEPRKLSPEDARISEIALSYLDSQIKPLAKRVGGKELPGENNDPEMGPARALLRSLIFAESRERRTREKIARLKMLQGMKVSAAEGDFKSLQPLAPELKKKIEARLTSASIEEAMPGGRSSNVARDMEIAVPLAELYDRLGVDSEDSTFMEDIRQSVGEMGFDSGFIDRYETPGPDKSAVEIRKNEYEELMDTLEETIKTEGRFAVKIGNKNKNSDTRAFILNARQTGEVSRGFNRDYPVTGYVFITNHGPLLVKTNPIDVGYPESARIIEGLLRGKPARSDSGYNPWDNYFKIGIEDGERTKIPLNEPTVTVRVESFEGDLSEVITQALREVHSPLAKRAGEAVYDTANARAALDILRPRTPKKE